MHRRIFNLSLLVVILLASCNLPASQTPAPTQQSQNVEPAELILLITEPAGGSEYPALASVPVSVQITGDAKIVELLIDNEPFEESQSPKYNRAHWGWASTDPGMHTLQARATDNEGNVYTSNSIIVWTSEAVETSTTLIQSEEGDTLNGLAERFNTTPQLIHDLNPYLPSDFFAPIPLNSPIKILNAYQAEIQSQFPNLDFDLPHSDEAQGSSAPQINFQPNADIPFESNSPLSSDLVFVDRTYYYLSLDNGPWSRVPRNQGEFLTPKNGFFDLEEVLAPLLTSAPSKDIHVTVDAWGWQGGALVFIGRFERIVEASENGEPWAILPGFLEICSNGTNCTTGEVTADFTQHVVSSTGGKHTLRWQLPPGITSGLWQTSTQPFGSSCELEPAYLYTNGTVSSENESTTFTVEFPPFYGEEMIFHARVLPLVNGQPDCTPSNTITLTLKTQEGVVISELEKPPAPPVAYDIEITDFRPIHFPDYKYKYCVTIVENPYYGTTYLDFLGVAPIWYEKPVGTNICPTPYQYQEPSTWDQITGFLKDAVNFVSNAYNTLKGFVVDIIAVYNPICLQANLVTESQFVKDACHAAAEVAVNAALTYVGLPPSLPNYDQLIETGKGELTELLAQQLEEQTGIPCTDECKDLIRDGIDAAVEEIGKQAGNSACMSVYEAHDKNIEPLCIPPAIKVKPMHEGQLEPALVTVQLTRKADVPDSAFPDAQLFDTSCNINVSGFAQNDSWIGQEIFIGQDYQSGDLVYWQGAPINGNLFDQIHVSAPVLAPGESTALTFALKDKRGVFPPGGSGFWLPGREQIYADTYYGSQLENYYGDAYDDWQYLYFGSHTTITASATCSTTFISPPAGAAPGGSSSSTSDEWTEIIPQQGE
ncbi:MAG: hypothetical protein HZB18_04140 [Chloroflexi bacterium]|nr:hypothetical protein [Chloroflexota bacterium]